MQFAAIFPGQGSQSTGMLAELANQYSEIKNTFDEASELIDKDLWKLITDEDSSALNETENTQPAMLAAGIAVWRIWLKQDGCMPIAMAGHSLGEYSAFVASGALLFEDAIKLVAKRASLMQQAVPAGAGAMAAILGLEDDLIVNVCANASVSGVVEAVNFNSPGQVVIAGESKAVDIAIEQLTEAGAKRAIKLPVSVPSHCSLMKNAAEQLNSELIASTFAETEYPVLQNVSAKSYDTTTERQDALAKQLYKPVLWVDTINNLEKNYGADTMIEFGPGKVLFGLNRRINRNLGNICITNPESLEKALAACAV
jgi:[acyl-carrier-protein] S-malonyltransferase